MTRLMHRGTMTALILATLLLPAARVSAQAAAVEVATRKPPNVLFMYSDDQQWNTIGAFGNEVIKTPNLDGLAHRGFSFMRTYCMGSWHGAVCVPSRAMMMTGRTLWRVKNDMSGSPTWPETLQKHGYAAFGAGKWHNGQASYIRSFNHGGHVMFGGMSDHDRVPAFRFNAQGRYPKEDRFIGGKFSSELFADDVIDFIRSVGADQPFAAYVAFTAPHDPRMAPEPYASIYVPDDIPLPPNFLPEHPFDNGELRVRDEKLAPFPRTPEVVRRHIADYYAMITHLDAQVGRILEALDEAGLAENTYVVFAGDHGLAVGQHGLIGKQSLYEHSMRAPLIIAGPGIPAGQRSDALCYLLDLFPTIFDLLDLETPESVEGESLAGIMRGDEVSVRDSLYCGYRDQQRMVRDDRYKLIRYNVKGVKTTQLFDLQEDPWEMRNLADDPAYSSILERLTVLFHEWKERVGDEAKGY